ncbi:N-acetylmuramoyl-L-alanine amidase [Dinoroseobacter sp. S124A]|uniref:N-acetylmuramoyl-L-alanine amidase n=1 Tax=Dinoroseobacter sp. S124A TaxID=3415128 RepID=UPI003C7AD9B0
MRQINLIAIHCTATDPDWMQGQTAKSKVMEIDRWHKARGWRGFGYHLLIDRDGTTAPGRDFAEAGAHIKGHNANSIGIVLVGARGASAMDSFSDHFTADQERTLRAELASLQARFPGALVKGHNEFANKGCPGFQVGPWLEAAAPKVVQPQGKFAAFIAAILEAFQNWRKS